MQSITLIGMLAGTLTTLAFLPQVVKTWRTRSADDISVGMLLLFSCGLVLWLIYGIAIAALPIILANSVTLLLTCAILIMKWRFATNNRYHTGSEKSLVLQPHYIDEYSESGSGQAATTARMQEVEQCREQLPRRVSPAMARSLSRDATTRTAASRHARREPPR